MIGFAWKRNKFKEIKSVSFMPYCGEISLLIERPLLGSLLLLRFY